MIQTNQERPFTFRPAQSYEEVSRKLLGDVLDRVFRGSRELLAGAADGAEGTLGQGTGPARGHLEEGREAVMNQLGAILWEGVIHATGFALVGILVYLVLRRWSPAAGSLVAASTLVVMAALSVLAFCPWPRWRCWGFAGSTPGGDVRVHRDRPSSGRPAQTSARHQPRVFPIQPAAADRPDRQIGQAWFSPSLMLWREAGAGVAGQSPSEAKLAELARRRARGQHGASAWSGWGPGSGQIRRMRLRSEPLDDPGLVRSGRASPGRDGLSQARGGSCLARPGHAGHDRLEATLVLLPGDWSEWDADERRAVLAHELAHVCRGDFLVGLLAQLSVAVQFYHPLAHWLSARLRLEQELAADAWSARLSGGTLAYLTTLGPYGPAPRRPGNLLAGAGISPVSWHFCTEDRDASQSSSGPSRLALVPIAFSHHRPACIGRPSDRRISAGRISPSQVRAQDPAQVPQVRRRRRAPLEKGAFDLAYIAGRDADSHRLSTGRGARAVPNWPRPLPLLSDLPIAGSGDRATSHLLGGFSRASRATRDNADHRPALGGDRPIR